MKPEKKIPFYAPDGSSLGFRSAEAAVDAVRDRALELGWTHERLYGRPASDQPGQRGDLVTALLRPGTRVGQITRQWIAIISPPPHENSLRLYNPDVEQPWVKCVGISLRPWPVSGNPTSKI